MTRLQWSPGLVALALALAPAVGWANERHFTLTYESAVLPLGGRELELWVTPRWGRDDFFIAYDQRVEFEVGVTSRLQSSLYFNFSQATEGVESQSNLGFSNEWKYKLLDSVADPVGLAFYGELSGSAREAELEAKVILDKRIGGLLVAFNAVGEHEWELAAGASARELKLEADLALSYFLTDGLSLGLELHDQAIFASDSGFESATLLGGPVVSYATHGWWAALSVTPQLTAVKSAAFAEEFPGVLELHDHQRFSARLLFAWHL